MCRNFLVHDVKELIKYFISEGWQVLETKIEAGYNAKEEVDKHLQADLVILQMPVNWFGAPWIYKKYTDEVFNYGLQTKTLLDGDGRTRADASKQYGSGGKMQGRKFMISATFNAPAEAFGYPQQNLMNGKNTEDLFLNISSNYKFCGYDILPGFYTFDIYKNPDIQKDLDGYPVHLKKGIMEHYQNQ